MAESHPIPTRPQFINLTGQRFGLLLVLDYAGKRDRGSMWRCRCDCGREIVTAGGHLRGGYSKSCGCRQAGAVVATHRLSKTLIYKAWKTMKTRCYNTKFRFYYRHGGRGIRVCDRWHKFENFYADMGPRPPGMSIDRIDNDGNYEPGNCRWATRKQQQANTRRRK